jgi:hypothetical protein
VLASGDRVHPFAGRFVSVVENELSKLPADGALDWSRWEDLFDHVTLRVTFGDGARDNRMLTELLEQLMSESNRLVGVSPSGDYYEFFGPLERQLRDPEPESLVARFADAPHGDRTWIVQQIPHWMFAMPDTLGANAYRGPDRDRRRPRGGAARV